jgi:hypothetical protein
MAKPDRRGFAAPPPQPPQGPPRAPLRGSRRGSGRPSQGQSRGYDDDDDDDGPPRRRGIVSVLFVMLVAGFGVFVWNAYGGGSDITAAIERVAAPDPYKTPGPGGDGTASASLEGMLREPGSAAAAESALAPEPEEPAPAEPAPPLSPAQLANQPMPTVVRNGPFVAQIAALQQERSIDPLWARLSARAPDLFSGAQLDVQTADLGPRGVSNRVRVGYFADRENATRFCDRMRAMGQECLVAQR